MRGPNVHAMYLLAGGAEVVEVEADPDCRAAGRRVADANRDAHTHVAAIVRNDRVLVPTDDERLEASDRLVVFNARAGVADLRRAFGAAA